MARRSFFGRVRKLLGDQWTQFHATTGKRFSADNMRYRRRTKERYPERERARKILARAVSRGEIVRPITCSRCGGGGEIQAHHPDYSQPLAVTWLCVETCHPDEHGGRSTGGNPARRRIPVQLPMEANRLGAREKEEDRSN